VESSETEGKKQQSEWDICEKTGKISNALSINQNEVEEI
jgi:hypothetical protein